MKFFVKVLALFIPLAVGLSAVAAVSYVNGQQILRQGAYEPERSSAYHALARLQNGEVPGAVAPGSDKVAIESDPSPWLLVTDTTGKPVAGNGYLHNVLPNLPAGVFDVTRTDLIDQLSWQPEPNVREVIVVLKAPNGFAVAGRSLSWTEWEEQALLLRSAFGWAGTMFLALVGAVCAALLLTKREK